MYYLLIITNCICYKYGARLWQIACFWVVLKEIFLGGRSPKPLCGPARTQISPAYLTILLGKCAPHSRFYQFQAIVYRLSLSIVFSSVTMDFHLCCDQPLPQSLDWTQK